MGLSCLCLLKFYNFIVLLLFHLEKVEEKVGSYIKQLIGDEVHWRLVNEMDAIDGLIQALQCVV